MQHEGAIRTSFNAHCNICCDRSVWLMAAKGAPILFTDVNGREVKAALYSGLLYRRLTVVHV